MITTDDLIDKIKGLNIKLWIGSLPNAIHGYYYTDGIKPTIVINEEIESNEALFRCVLAEELAHHMRTVGSFVDTKSLCYADRINISKEEETALRWACDFLIPTDELLSVMNQSGINKETIAEHFIVTKKFFMRKLYFMSKRQMIYKISNTKTLMLQNYPGIYVYEDIEGFYNT